MAKTEEKKNAAAEKKAKKARVSLAKESYIGTNS